MDRHRRRVLEDMMSLLCGEQLGEGISRTVYAHALDPTLVVKVARLGYHCNISEYGFWEDNQNCERVARWLAPCVRLSTDGLILLQRRVSPIRTEMESLPEKMPSFLSDLKPENYGWLEGRLVCCDYAWTFTQVPTRLRKVDWRV